ncbi:hypothetical protein FPQ18DRAFT_308516 [Pyronema domesticum]|uniref:Uncharacterized protein n=1 Tax=Pyronema omphalodes (strain CBS 100304) TaxID=1076935 RepID=U4L3T2_PYROM|nr:hypothetical protein FPQ18DRAFT_308516 [Pyronema domesticum]CCX04715.1 Protein of unknown function [Pyronema omphalodes CBS 100304]
MSPSRQSSEKAVRFSGTPDVHQYEPDSLPKSVPRSRHQSRNEEHDVSYPSDDPALMKKTYPAPMKKDKADSFAEKTIRTMIAQEERFWKHRDKRGASRSASKRLSKRTPVENEKEDKRPDQELKKKERSTWSKMKNRVKKVFHEEPDIEKGTTLNDEKEMDEFFGSNDWRKQGYRYPHHSKLKHGEHKHKDEEDMAYKEKPITLKNTKEMDDFFGNDNWRTRQP